MSLRLPAAVIMLFLLALNLHAQAPTRLEVKTPVQPEFTLFKWYLQGSDRDLTPTEMTLNKKAVFDKMARWFVHRLTWPEVQRGEGSVTLKSLVQRDSVSISAALSKVEEMAAHHVMTRIEINARDYEPDQRELLAKKQKQQAFQAEFTPFLVAAAKEAMTKDQPLLVHVNAAMILHLCAEAGQPEVAGYLQEILANPRPDYDAVRHWALRSLAELFARYAVIKNRDELRERKDEKKEREEWMKVFAKPEQHLLPIYTWLDQKTQMAKLQAAEYAKMSEEEKHAVSIVRRGAIQALGNARRPFALDDKTVEGPLAELLVRIVRSDVVTPEPTFRERVEAARALLHLQASKNFKPDETAHHIARFIADLAGEYNQQMGGRGEPWVFYGWYLQLEGEQTGALANSAYWKKALQFVKPVLDRLQKGGETNRQAVQELSRWLDANPPPMKGP